MNLGCARYQMNDLGANAFLLLPSVSLLGKQERPLSVLALRINEDHPYKVLSIVSHGGKCSITRQLSA